MDTNAPKPTFSMLTPGVWIIAAVAIGYVLQQSRGILAPFALAVFVWMVMEGFARAMRKPAPWLPNWLAHSFSVAIVLAGVIAFISVMRGAVVEFAGKSNLYEARINELISDAYALLHLQGAPTLSQVIYSDATASFVEPVLNSVQGLASDLVLIMIYIAFLYISSATFSKKLDNIFIKGPNRTKARNIGEAVRDTMEKYLWVQTALSLITTLLTYITLIALGLDNALFWAVIIFVLNYIPTIGSIIATALPALFAVAQPLWPEYMPTDPMLCAAAVFAGVSIWQFVIGNFLGPRMMGESLNLDPLIVLLSLAIWGAIWGIPGMFLSAPLSVLLMIILSQTKGARWIAVLMSADGKPGVRRNAQIAENTAQTPPPTPPDQ